MKEAKFNWCVYRSKIKKQRKTDLFAPWNAVSNLPAKSLLEAQIDQGSADIFWGFEAPTLVCLMIFQAKIPQ